MAKCIARAGTDKAVVTFKTAIGELGRFRAEILRKRSIAAMGNTGN